MSTMRPAGRLRLFGHPAHPPLTHLPLGLWSGALCADLAALVRPEGAWWSMAAWCLAAGAVVALPAAITGFAEYAGLPADHPAGRTASLHGLAMGGAICLFLLALLLHRGAFGGGAPDRPVWAAAATAAGAAVLVWGGWLGGHLVFHHGLAVQGRAGAGPAAAGFRQDGEA